MVFCVINFWLRCLTGHRPNSFVCLAARVQCFVGGSLGRDCRNCQTFAASPAEPGDLPVISGVYREIAQDKRIVFTFTWENHGPSAGAEMLVTITFEEHDGKTVQTFHQRPFVTVERRDSHVDGWNQAFGKLETYVVKLAKEQAA